MDAAAADADVKLYKASGELLAELQAKLPLLLTKADGTLRKWILFTKTTELARLLDSFQEWPQLLDPILAGLVRLLVDAFLSHCVHKKDIYHHKVSMPTTQIESLPRAVCRLLYVLCKVRGYKVILRLLSNEPKFIEPLLKCFQSWNSTASGQPGLSWEERYIMLLWLSHLMLAPFQLSTISASSNEISIDGVFEDVQLPNVAKVMLGIAFGHLCIASKDREAASLLIVRLALREDMQRLHLSQRAIQWCISQLASSEDQMAVDQYRSVGLLTLLFSLTNSSSSTEAAPFIQRVFDACVQLATDAGAAAVRARHSAPSRKLLIKTMRSTILHMLSLANAGSDEATDNIDSMLEHGIQILLESLADTDTPVRQAASKALGMIILKLDRNMAAEVIEAVLGCLNENMLLENLETGHLTAATDLFDVDTAIYKKNVNAVDPLKWHGVMLTLGHVLFRRSPPPEQLPVVLEALLIGLVFEQRSNVGTSLGIGVRDAACFGIWSLARKYTTQEILGASLPRAATANRWYVTEQHTLQVVATELVLASCLDPSGNLRRGASAALQELIGRHPDTVRSGIAVVQQVDYHAVARRSKALLDVSKAVAQLDEEYHLSLMYAMLDWRGCRAVDAESRRQAALAVGQLFGEAETVAQGDFTKALISQIGELKESNVGLNAASRHGLLLSLAAVMQARDLVSKSKTEVLDICMATFGNLDKLAGSMTGRVTSDLAGVLEAVASLLASAASAAANPATSERRHLLSQSTMSILDRCTTASEAETVCTAAAAANSAVFNLLSADSQVALLKSWLPDDLPNQKSLYTCRGRIASLGVLGPVLCQNPDSALFVRRIVGFLGQIVSSQLPIETKVNAMQGVSDLCQSGCVLDIACLSSVAQTIAVGLTNYTVDQRGDVGSWLRLGSIEALKRFSLQAVTDESLMPLMRLVVRLAAEKLTNVRFAAWDCLRRSKLEAISQTERLDSIEHQADVSSFAYFSNLMSLLNVPELGDAMLTGLVSSVAGGTEGISQNASKALVTFLDSHTGKLQVQQLERVINGLLQRLKQLSDREDREVVPVLETLCLIREQFPFATDEFFKSLSTDLWHLIDVLHSPVADIARVQAIIRLHLSLCSISELKRTAADRISRKLLHKWPKIRQSAADSIYMIDSQALNVAVDWNMAPLKNKPRVIEARKAIGVAGQA